MKILAKLKPCLDRLALKLVEAEVEVEVEVRADLHLVEVLGPRRDMHPLLGCCMEIGVEKQVTNMSMVERKEALDMVAVSCQLVELLGGAMEG